MCCSHHVRPATDKVIASRIEERFNGSTHRVNWWLSWLVVTPEKGLQGAVHTDKNGRMVGAHVSVYFFLNCWNFSDREMCFVAFQWCFRILISLGCSAYRLVDGSHGRFQLSEVVLDSTASHIQSTLSTYDLMWCGDDWSISGRTLLCHALPTIFTCIFDHVCYFARSFLA